MKRMILVAAVAALGFAAVPSHADPPASTPVCGSQNGSNGVVLTTGFTGAADAPDESCTFTSDGNAIQYVVATPNHWSITATHVDSKGHTIVDASASGVAAGTAQGPGTLNGATTGDTVTVTEGNDCVSEPVCGQGGVVIAVQQ